MSTSHQGTLSTSPAGLKATPNHRSSGSGTSRTPHVLIDVMSPKDLAVCKLVTSAKEVSPLSVCMNLGGRMQEGG